MSDPLANQQPELFEPEHTSPWASRLPFSVAERVYLTRWRQWNREVAHVNHLLKTNAITNRDTAIAASFAQWLGTNCGRGYIAGCEREINDENELRDLISIGWNRRRYIVRPSFTDMATTIAKSVDN